ncbi:hypothetical protein FRC03_011880 [Tulasnella sp. 419]|nr:hypothetical protein FRC03_011880 [Tulasnella sp. 419]
MPTNSIALDSISFLAIYPPVGVARLGESEEFVLRSSNYESSKDSNGALKRQAALFKVLAYDSEGQVIGEVNKDNGFELTWTAKVANTKAAQFTDQSKTLLRNPSIQPNLPPEQRTKLMLTASQRITGTRNQSGLLIAEFYGSQDTATTANLGELRIDHQGRLLFLGGKGVSRCYPMISGSISTKMVGLMILVMV